MLKNIYGVIDFNFHKITSNCIRIFSGICFIFLEKDSRVYSDLNWEE